MEHTNTARGQYTTFLALETCSTYIKDDNIA